MLTFLEMAFLYIVALVAICRFLTKWNRSIAALVMCLAVAGSADAAPCSSSAAAGGCSLLNRSTVKTRAVTRTTVTNAPAQAAPAASSTAQVIEVRQRVRFFRR